MSSIIDLYHAAKIQKIDEAAIAMEYNGFMIDPKYCNAGYAQAQKDERQVLDALAIAYSEATGHTVMPWMDDVWASHKQLTAFLHDILKLPPSPYKFKGKVKIDEGERSTDKVALDWLINRACADRPRETREALENIVGLRRIRSSAKYLEKLPRFIGPDGFIHPVCGPAGDEDDRVGAVTGRFGMKLPEGQQIPKDAKKDRYCIRRAFIAPPGQRLIVADYSALEVVILANISDMMFGDDLLLHLTGPGEDIHAYNAYNIFGRLLNWSTDSGRRIADYPQAELYKTDKELAWYRDLVKSVWYKLQYGGTVHGFATSLKDKNGEPIGEKRATEIVDALYAACPPIKKWHDFVRGYLQKHNGIPSLDGRWFDYAPLIERGKWGFEAACRAADNSPMQGTGAGVIGSAMVAVYEHPEIARLGGVTQLQIHDELQLRGPGSSSERLGELLKECMEGAFPLKNLRAEVGIGDNWYEAKAA